MSSTVKSYGFIAVLTDPLTEEEREELSEALYDSKSGLNINYEGTLVYIDFNQHEPYDVRENIYGLTIGESTEKGRELFYAELYKNAICTALGTVEHFEEIWHNASDSCIDCLTVEQYYQIINKEAK